MKVIDTPPLLTIAIPTFNRGGLLRELLASLVPQLKLRSEIEFIISDNCSPDDTQEVIKIFSKDILSINYVRNSVNIGSDENFIQCFHLARGKFFWLLGDDDIVMPGAIEKIISLLRNHSPDLVHLSSSVFHSDYVSETRPDPLSRGYRIISDSGCFVRLTNVMLTFISSNIINRDRLLEINCKPVELARGSHLIQLSWTL